MAQPRTEGGREVERAQTGVNEAESGIFDPSGPTGPVIFAHPVARAQLLAEGVMFTFKTDARTVGETHARWERNGSGKLDVTIEHAAEVDPSESDDLMPYSEQSGFLSVEAWQEAIRELNKWFPETGHVYCVTLDGYRVNPRPGYLYAVGTRSTHESRHEAIGVAAIINGERAGNRMSVSSYPVCECEERHFSAKFLTCQLCGGVNAPDR